MQGLYLSIVLFSVSFPCSLSSCSYSSGEGFPCFSEFISWTLVHLNIVTDPALTSNSQEHLNFNQDMVSQSSRGSLPTRSVTVTALLQRYLCFYAHSLFIKQHHGCTISLATFQKILALKISTLCYSLHLFSFCCFRGKKIKKKKKINLYLLLWLLWRETQTAMAVRHLATWGRSVKGLHPVFSPSSTAPDDKTSNYQFLTLWVLDARRPVHRTEHFPIKNPLTYILLVEASN